MDTGDAAPAFDTLAIVQKLEAAGVDRKQAEAHAEALHDSQARLATKADIARLDNKIETIAKTMAGTMATKADLADLRADFCRALWIRTGAIVGTIIAAAGFSALAERLV